jgi:hypothetical protein
MVSPNQYLEPFRMQFFNIHHRISPQDNPPQPTIAHPPTPPTTPTTPIHTTLVILLFSGKSPIGQPSHARATVLTPLEAKTASHRRVPARDT